MYGGYATHPAFIAWITTLEKIRRNEPRYQPLKVIFSWQYHLVGERDTKLEYDRSIVEPCECDMVGFSVGRLTREAYLALFGTEPIDWEKERREGKAIPLERMVQVREDVENQQVIMRDPFTKTMNAIKKVDPKE